jgi:hypothetical protein
MAANTHKRLWTKGEEINHLNPDVAKCEETSLSDETDLIATCAQPKCKKTSDSCGRGFITQACLKPHTEPYQPFMPSEGLDVSHLLGDKTQFCHSGWGCNSKKRSKHWGLLLRMSTC